MSKIKVSIGDFGSKGYSFPVKSKVIASSLMEIYGKKNELTPEVVVKEAKAKNHPLHSCFEWNDTKAANEHRLSMARVIICSVTVNKDLGGKIVPIRAFVHIQRDKEGKLSTNPYKKGESNYVYIDSAMSSDVLKRHTVERALNDLQNLIDKYNNLEQLAGLFDMISKKIKMIKKGKAGTSKKVKK